MDYCLVQISLNDFLCRYSNRLSDGLKQTIGIFFSMRHNHHSLFKQVNEHNTLGLRTAVYLVPDLATATQWYTKILETEPYYNSPFYVGYNVGGYELGLHPISADSHKPALSVVA